MSIPIVDLRSAAGKNTFAKVLARLRGTSSIAGEAAQLVAKIIGEVKEEGDAGLVRYMRQWTDPEFDASQIRVSPTQIKRAGKNLPGALREAMKRAIAHVKEYQSHIMPKAQAPIMIDGAELGLRFTPVDSVGLAVPGGRAAYPSSLIMLAVPALVAGVPADKIAVVSPPPTRTADAPPADISPLVLAACDLLGITRVYRIGGAQAIAALAHGTRSVARVDLVAGPGNIFVQLAKAQLAGVIGTDNGFYGPSEIVTLADASADSRRIAADLIAQAEHDPGKCFLVAWSRKVIDDIAREIADQKRHRKRVKAIDAALTGESAAILCKHEAQAVEVANILAAEHVNLAVKDPERMLAKVRHGGEFFLGDNTPVAAGDYYAGPSHCLPTGSTARFASGVSAYTFLKRSGTVWYRKGMGKNTIADIAALAEAEGLDGHAHSARVRG